MVMRLRAASVPSRGAEEQDAGQEPAEQGRRRVDDGCVEGAHVEQLRTAVVEQGSGVLSASAEDDDAAVPASDPRDGRVRGFDAETAASIFLRVGGEQKDVASGPGEPFSGSDGDGGLPDPTFVAANDEGGEPRVQGARGVGGDGWCWGEGVGQGNLRSIVVIERRCSAFGQEVEHCGGW
jgi:hypothetical protein